VSRRDAIGVSRTPGVDGPPELLAVRGTRVGAPFARVWLMSVRHVLLVIAVVTALSGCGLRRPEVGLASVHVGALRLDGADLDLRLDIHNPNRWRIDLQELTYQLSVDDVGVGSGATTAPFVVPARDCATLTLPVDVRWRGLGRVGRELLSGEVEYRVVGHVRVGTPVGSISRRFDRTSRFSPLTGRRGGGPLCAEVATP
jgi:LEA14-like dessication related protein